MSILKKVDFSEVSGGFKVVSEGSHEAYVYEMSEETSKAGNDMIKVVFKIADGEFKGSTLFHYLVFTEKAMFKVKEFVRACGDGAEYSGEDVDFEEYKGKKVTLDIKHEEFGDNKKITARIDKITSCEDEDDSPAF